MFNTENKSNQISKLLDTPNNKPITYVIKPWIFYQNITADTVRNISTKKLSQYTKDTQIIMPLFLSMNLFMINSINLLQRQVIGVPSKSFKMNLTYPLLSGWLTSIKTCLFAYSESGFELDGPTMSALNLVAIPVASQIESQALNKFVSNQVWVSIIFIFAGVQIIARFKFKESSVIMDSKKQFRYKKDDKKFVNLYNRVRNIDFSKDNILQTNNLNINTNNLTINKSNINIKKSINNTNNNDSKTNLLINNSNHNKILLNSTNININNTKTYKDIENNSSNEYKSTNEFDSTKEYNSSNISFFQKFKNKFMQDDKANASEEEIQDVHILAQKLYEQKEYDYLKVKFNKIMARVVGVILECVTFWISHLLFKQNDYSVNQQCLYKNISELIFMSFFVIYVVSQYKNSEMQEALQKRQQQQMTGFFTSEEQSISQMSKFAWLTVLSENQSQQQQIKKSRVSVLGVKINCWGQVLSPFIFASDTIMGKYKKDLNIVTLIGITLISLGIKLNQVIQNRISHKIYQKGTMIKMRSNGNQMNFS